MDEEATTLAERYTHAAQSSHLRVEPGRCDVDMLIAAGRLSSPLGALLWRLRGEFDAARAAVRPDGGELNLTERALALMELRSLHACKQQMWTEILTWLSGDRAISLGREEAALVAGRVIDAWIDPTCPGCEGRGFNGGRHRGEQEVKCGACRGSKLRRTSIAMNATQRVFADRVQALIDESMFVTSIEMARMLREHAIDGA